ncbi:MAG: pyridoxal phosphate-dependent aminotransferase, partial [Alphaproteobacteria bacterium]|nr:pyridoxal phosphate-dependent aminotransferase [Alphaproteobacteria bacterium]
DGAFYIYADVSGFGEDSQVFAARMLEEIAVATTPGIDFDTQHGGDWLRFSFAGSPNDIAEAAERLVAWRR